MNTESSVNNYQIIPAGTTQLPTATVYGLLYATYSGGNLSGMTTVSTEMFELTTSAGAYMGHDGTQVGIHGGLFPFNPRVSTYKVTVPQSSNSNGVLEVGIQNVNE